MRTNNTVEGSDSINNLKFKVFKNSDNQNESLKFFEAYRQLLFSKGIKGLKSARPNWLENPSVYLLALYSGNAIVGGARIHLNHPSFRFPMEEVLVSESVNRGDIAIGNNGERFAEACGLWLSVSLSKLGLGEFLSKATIAASHELGLDYIYGLCPRHTLDPFRESGWHFLTKRDDTVSFVYPSPEFITYVIKCEVRHLRFTFKAQQKLISKWLNNPRQTIVTKGKLGECAIELTGFPKEREFYLEPFVPSSDPVEMLNSDSLLAKV